MFYFKNVGRDLAVFLVVSAVVAVLDEGRPQFWVLPAVLFYVFLGFAIGFYKKLTNKK